MAQNDLPAYEVGRLLEVTRQVQEMGRNAVELGLATEFAEAMKTIFARLQTKPSEWGDPEYRLKKKGSTVYHGIHFDLIVRYAVFELEQKVLLLAIGLLPTSPLAS